MSEPLTREEREEMRGAYGDHTKPGRCLNDLEALETRLEQAKKLQQLTLDNEIRWMRKHSEAEVERDTIHAQLEALEKQHAADLEAQQAAMLKCIREERVSKQAELENSERFLKIANETNADLRAQLEWCESERNAARARCEQLEQLYSQ